MWSLSNSENSTFQYIKMLFGLANVGSAYSRILDVALKKVDRYFWISYLDDILTFSSFRTFDTGSLGTGGSWNPDTTLQDQAVSFKGEYLGHKISKGGVIMIPEYLQRMTY